MRKFLFSLPLLLLAGCTETDFPQQPAAVSMHVSAVLESTKTSLSGTTLSWTDADTLGIFVEGLHSNVKSFNSSSSPSLFLAYFPVLEQYQESVSYRAYYPHVNDASGTVVNGILPSSQTAPFDKTANYMVSNAVLAKYDEEDMPSMSLSFDTQLFAIVKINVKNTIEDYSDDFLHGIELVSSEGKCMAGDFTFDMSSSLPTPIFDSSQPVVSSVSSVFSSPVEMGLYRDHTVYLFVPKGVYSGLKVRVKTDGHLVTTSTTEAVTFESGKVTTLPDIDFATMGDMEKTSMVACWGDSYTNNIFAAYPLALQNLLGEKWFVYDGGSSGDRTQEIAARQGGIKSYITNGFTFPAAVQYVSLTPTNQAYIHLEDSELTEDSVKPFRWSAWTTSTSMLNPAIVGGVECTLTYKSIQRLAVGEVKNVAAGAEITTFGSRISKRVDVTIIYMGGNGGWNRDESDFDLLIKQHQAMLANTNSDKYVIMTMHHKTSWNYDEYIASMDSAFGDHILDLRFGVISRGEEMVVKTGLYSSPEEMTANDKWRLSRGDWPIPFQLGESDLHPNSYGIKAIAFLIHDKMVKLGYLEDSYILNDPSDL